MGQSHPQCCLHFSVCVLSHRVITHHGYDSDGEGDEGAVAGGSGDEAAGGAAASGSAGRAEAGASRGPAVPVDPETVFMQVSLAAGKFLVCACCYPC